MTALLRLLAALGRGRGSVSAGGGAVGGRGGLALRHVGGGALLLVARLVLSPALLIRAINITTLLTFTLTLLSNTAFCLMKVPFTVHVRCPTDLLVGGVALLLVLCPV